MAKKSKSKKKKRGLVKKILFTFVAVFIALATIEGTVSLLMFAFDLAFYSEPAIAERQHTQYDEEIGWINTPGRQIQNIYGPGLSVTINNQGFRAPMDFAEHPPQEKTRVICTGCSFTLGYGVDDDDTWCAQLADVSPQYEVVNMGQGGYGLDQSYLWYERDGRDIWSNVHLVCLTQMQFERMLYKEFLGYGKPTLASLEGGQPAADNVPVPKRAFYLPWMTQNAGVLQRSRTVQAISRMFAGEPERVRVLSANERDVLALQAISIMAKNDALLNCKLIVVWLPIELECRAPVNKVGSRTLDQIRSQGIPVIDLTDAFRQESDEVLSSYFIREDDVQIQFKGAVGHYSETGNQFVAKQLATELDNLLTTSQEN